LKHPGSYVSLSQLNELYKSYGTDRAKMLFNSLSPLLRNHSVGKQLGYKIFEAEQLTALNKKAISFQQRDTASKIVRLEDYRGKYVLLDFWASWCIPCRAENPNIKKAYAQYSSKGFDVLGVSLDNNREAWIKALIKDDLPWKNVSDLKGFKNVVSQQYAVTELPTNYLLDPSGRIIAKNLKSEELLEKLRVLFGD
jgi:peroxiredoxin